jgi:putative oxygen-independent coproporphyrinogen III oxidase
MTAAKSLQDSRDSQEPAALGVYVHFPWCLKKCPYCDFLSIAADRDEIPQAGYAKAVQDELFRRRAELGQRRLRSVFFGGGTPSLWEPSELGRVLVAIRAAFPGSEPEVTVECNPTSFDRERARALRDQGVGRVSIGVQSLDPGRLAFLGRLHDPAGAVRAVGDAIASGLPRVSADLIFGVSGQAPASAVDEALAIAELGVTHLSAYALTIEPGTQFGMLAKRGKLPLLSEHLVAESFVLLERALERVGFAHYEISNYARRGHVAEHNLGYWRGDDYLGLGCGAWGTLTTSSGRRRYRNTPSVERYLAAPGASESDVEPIEPQTALRERLMLGLRLAAGFDLVAAASELGVEPWPPERVRAAERLVTRGRLEQHGDRLVIPKSAWLYADGTISELL